MIAGDVFQVPFIHNFFPHNRRKPRVNLKAPARPLFPRAAPPRLPVTAVRWSPAKCCGAAPPTTFPPQRRLDSSPTVSGDTIVAHVNWSDNIQLLHEVINSLEKQNKVLSIYVVTNLSISA